jgi:membrane-bound lytic murein transglycosylase MltF
MSNLLLICKELLLLLLAGALLLCSCGENRALDRIKKSGTITVITRNNAHCYYTYRNQEMGFEYELAKAFADFLGVELEVRVFKSWNELLPSLDKEGGDFVAASVPPQGWKWQIFQTNTFLYSRWLLPTKTIYRSTALTTWRDRPSVSEGKPPTRKGWRN